MKVTISEPEVKVPRFLVLGNQLDTGKSDVTDSNTFSSSEGKFNVTPQDLSERWGISLSIASMPLQNTTQKFLCIAILTLARRYRTDQLFTRNTLLGEWLMDIMDGRGFSLEGKECAQLFSNKSHFPCVYLMDSNNKLGDTFIYICQEFGVP